MEARNLELRVTKLEERVERWEVLQQGVNTTLLQILKEQNEFKTEVRQKFELIDQKFELIDQKFELMDQKFELIDQRLTRLEEGLLGLAQNQQKIEDILITIVNKLS